MNLFLDDIRNPNDAYINGKSLLTITDTTVDDWTIVRNYDDFCMMVRNVMPEMISFDHDLHFEHMRHYADVTVQNGVIEYGNLKHKTGKSCAEFLVSEWRRQGMVHAPKFYIHSANQWGSIEIAKVLKELQ